MSCKSYAHPWHDKIAMLSLYPYSNSSHVIGRHIEAFAHSMKYRNFSEDPDSINLYDLNQF